MKPVAPCRPHLFEKAKGILSLCTQARVGDCASCTARWRILNNGGTDVPSRSDSSIQFGHRVSLGSRAEMRRDAVSAP